MLPSALGKKSSRVGETTYGGERERTGVNTQHYNMEGRKEEKWTKDRKTNEFVVARNWIPEEKVVFFFTL